MKSKITSCCLFAIFVFANFFVNAQEKNGDEMHDENLKGIAKKVSIAFYYGGITDGKKPHWTSIQYYNKMGKITSYHQYNKFGRLEDNDTYFYDEKSHLIKVRYEEYGKLQSISVINYDSSGRLSEVLSLDADSVLKHRNTYNHSQNAVLIETIYNISADSIVSKNIDKLDSRGNSIESKVYDKNDNIVRTWRSEYDYMNNFISQEEFSADNKLVSNNTHVYTYYPNKNMKTDINYQNGIINSKESFDIHGNMIEVINYSGSKDNDVTSKEIDKYKYDSKGNWTEKIDYENGEVFTSEIRTIKY